MSSIINISVNFFLQCVLITLSIAWRSPDCDQPLSFCDQPVINLIMPYLYLHLSDELVISKLQGREMYHHSTYVHVHVQSKCACTCACMYKIYSTLEANKTYMYNYTSCCCLTMITLYFSTECWSLIMGLHCFECFHHIWKATACVHSNGMETVTQK